MVKKNIQNCILRTQPIKLALIFETFKQTKHFIILLELWVSHKPL